MTNDIEQFLQVGPFQNLDGAITPLAHFRREFIAWLDCPVRQNFWSQRRRVEAMLQALGFPIGYMPETAIGGRYGQTRGEFGGLYIGNLGESVRPGDRRFVVEDGYLVSTDFTATPSGEAPC